MSIEDHIDLMQRVGKLEQKIELLEKKIQLIANYADRSGGLGLSGLDIELAQLEASFDTAKEQEKQQT